MISAKLPKTAVPEVLGDSGLIRRVLDNFVHNAVEHTPAGGSIRVEVSFGSGRVRVAVCDSGPGVPEEARADIFRKFFQKEMKRHVGNVGLGLAFCEKVVLRHDGVIGIEDAKPKGACFFFALPATQGELL
jgi:signal transduction histidine kinase